jgi:hypothetical protein
VSKTQLAGFVIIGAILLVLSRRGRPRHVRRAVEQPDRMLTVDVRYFEDDTWRGYAPVWMRRELLIHHMWVTFVAGLGHYPQHREWCELGGAGDADP